MAVQTGLVGSDGSEIGQGAGEVRGSPSEDVWRYLCSNAEISVGTTDWEYIVFRYVLGCGRAGCGKRYHSK